MQRQSYTDKSPFAARSMLNCRGKLVDISQGAIMGIINTTPDSFFSGSRTEVDELLFKAEKMLGEGADFLDIGGYSTRPGADDVPEEEELKRVIPAIERLANAFPEAIISIDTFRARVAEEAIHAGASIINDVSGGEEDETMFDTVARLQVPYVLMHRKGTPKTMQRDPQYEDVTREVIECLSRKLHHLHRMGVHDVLLDPGFGFGKTLTHNYTLLRQLKMLRILGCPILVGVSRKGMIHRLLNIRAEDALNGTTAVHTMALLNGTQVLRVHDVQAARQVLQIVNFCRGTL